MATRTTLNVSLPVELGRYIESMVNSGRYASASEVVRTALRQMQEQAKMTERVVEAREESVRDEEGVG
ncbi:MAG: type II toxin-antitoxin system ParD family antitoxin [Hyphomicrobiaceae bacterium]